MRNLIFYAVFLFSLSFFLGCGSGQYDSSHESNNTRIKTNQKDIKIYGYVIDGYVENATVFIDTNLNQIPDENEIQTKTSSNGYYELLINQIPVSNEIEVMAYGGEDIIFKTPLKGILKAQADYTNQDDIELNLTPLSTLAVAYKEVFDGYVSIGYSTQIINEYAKANDLLKDPIEQFPQNQNDLKQNIKLHNLMLSLTQLKYNNKNKENVYETYKQIAKDIKKNETIDNIKTYKVNNKTLNITKLKQTIFENIQNTDDLNASMPSVLDDTSTNPENYIPKDETPTLDTGSTTPTPTPTPTPTNTPPKAFDLNITTNEDTDITGKLKAKDDDNNTLTYIVASNPSHGSVNIESNGSFTYEVGLNYHGTDSFTFKVNDGTVDSNEANVSITINSINDKPIAKDFNITNTNIGKTINWKILSLALDAEDGNNLTAELNTSNQPTKGNVAINNENLTYTPNPNQNGNDTFKLNIKDTKNLSTTITIHVKDIDTIIPTITTTNIPNNHQVDTNLTINFSKDINTSSYQTGYITLKENNTTNTNFTYNFTNSQTLTIDANLTYSKSYTLNIKNLKDTTGNTLEAKEFTFTTQNFIPTANDFTISNVGTEKTVNWKILSNAQDSPNDTLSADLNTSPSYGSVNISGDELTYTPNSNIDNNDAFKLNIKDANGGVVVINVQTQGADTIKPSIIFASSKPDINGTDFLVDENLTYNFSESIDISSVTISLSPSTTLTHSLTNTNKTLNIKPSSNLDYNKKYTLTLSGIKDIAGNILENQIITFTTRSNIYFVDKSASGTNDGSSWANAGTSLQDAINAVTGDADRQIWIKAGIYNISTTLTLKNKVYMYGGFAGNETKLNQRLSTNETILDGGKANQILSANGITDALIDGITFQNGNYTDGGAIHNKNSSYTIQNSSFKENKMTKTYGGAIYNQSSSMLIKNCYFYKNDGKYGGGIVNRVGATIVESSTFEQNHATNGAAIYLETSKSLVKDCNFTNNTATYGAVLSRFSDKSTIKNSIFKNNEGRHGGAFTSRKNSTPTIINSQFIENVGITKGGAIYVDSNADLNISDSNITKNTAPNGGAIYSVTSTQTSINIKNINFSQNNATSNGGVIYVSNIKELTIKDSNFTKNKTTNYGGAIRGVNIKKASIENSNFTKNVTKGQGGGICIDAIPELIIIDSNFIKNESGTNGGGISAINTKLDINGTNFIQNKTTTSAHRGGGIYVDKGNVNINSSSFFDNYSKAGGGMLLSSDSNLTLTNSTFSKNKAFSGGGLYMLKNITSSITNTSFVENSAEIGVGGLFNRGGSTSTISNSIFWNNSTTSSSYPNDLSNIESSSLKINFSIIKDQANSNITSQSSTITNDPNLKPFKQNGITYYYNLDSLSPAINAGNNANMTLTTDQIGNPRKNGIVDIGAIEKQ